MRRGVVLFAVLAALGAAPAASASWFPHPADATWTYEWTDTVYNTTPTKEKVTVREQKGPAFVLAWTTKDQGNPDGAPAEEGIMAFQEATAGLLNTDWQSSPPPSSFPILCAQQTRCANSLVGTLYQLIWGTRAPVLAEPLLAGTTWTARGGADGDVTSVNQYLGRERITVPAFPSPVTAAKVRSDITQAGALGDPYGSGVRTVWWVYGVGPVKVVFEHAGGSGAPVTTSVLTSTNQTPGAAPSDADYFPLKAGAKARYRWTNTAHLKKASIQEATVVQVANGSARIDVKHVSGPIRVVGSYGFSRRRDGLTNIWGASRSASLATFPPLGPAALPKDRRRRFFTPFDLMNFGLNPIMTAYPSAGETWAVTAPSRDYSVYGATGSSKILGFRRVKVPAGTFNALVVQSSLTQRGFPFGSGTRTSYFAAGRGLVKLVFRHKDRSVSTVERLK